VVLALIMGSVKVTSLNPGEQYYAQVRALDDEGVSTEWSKTYRFTAGNAPADNTITSGTWSVAGFEADPSAGEDYVGSIEIVAQGNPAKRTLQTQVFSRLAIHIELGYIPEGEDDVGVVSESAREAYHKGDLLISTYPPAYIKIFDTVARSRIEYANGEVEPWFWTPFPQS